MDSPTTSSSMQQIDFNVERMVKNKSRIYSRRLALAKAVQKRKDVLFGSSNSFEDGGTLTNNQRRDAWEAVRQELLRKGFGEFSNKSRLDIQKTDWQHVRRYVMDKRKRDSPNKDDPITELDTVVFDIVKSFGRYSTRDSADNNTDDNEILIDDVRQYVNGTISPAMSPKNDFGLEDSETNHLPHLSQLLNLRFPPETSDSPPPERNDVQTKIVEVRLQKEEYLRDQEKIRLDIESEKLVQERIRTKLLLAQLSKESPQMASEFKSSE